MIFMKIFCIGHATYDITLPLEKYPLENTKTKTNKKVECGGGSAANAAVLLAKWQEKSYYVGAVGNDYYGARIEGAFINNKVNTKYLEIKKDNYTSTSFIIASMNNGKRTIMTFKDESLKASIYNIKEKADVLYFDGEHLELALSIIKNNPNSLKIIDAGSYKEEVIKLCPLMDYVVCSKDFAEAYTKEKIDDLNPDTLKKIIKKIEKDFKNKVIITLEENGSYTKINKRYKIIPSIKVKAVDSTGAGDIYHAALTYFLAHNYDLERAIRLANISGAISVTRFGGRFSIPSLKEVLALE